VGVRTQKSRSPQGNSVLQLQHCLHLHFLDVLINFIFGIISETVCVKFTVFGFVKMYSISKGIKTKLLQLSTKPSEENIMVYWIHMNIDVAKLSFMFGYETVGGTVGAGCVV